ncbi:hypothetical protein SUGI_1493140 [Cryptomeria japonica]|uniref:DNA-directed RNA polymerase III subunit RPC5 n=1 Tax=Cryptomeria japonica TaxID=3369 RepID=A0AAD3NU72_CRYJA|nr:uncharacterized protein LOC131872740 [Cryptomeria japonica]GLJ59117.1 hypothetical protein SUGI_1493140 [Cryptomeria japonica]
MAKQRFDLYIENSMSDETSSLVLMRFPAMQSQFENPEDMIKLSVKPKSLKFKLETLLDQDTNNYCHEQASELLRKSNPKSFASGKVDRNFWSSTKVSVDDGQLFVCKIVDERVVCRPISHLFTMRSDFSHFDLKDEVDPKEEARPISVKFAAPDRPNVFQKSQLNNQETDDPSDDYRVLSYKPAKSEESYDQRITLFGRNKLKVEPDIDAGLEDKKPDIVFLPDIKPKIEKIDQDIYSSEVVNSQQSPRKSVQIRERVKDCLLKAKLVSFEEVYQFVKGYNRYVSDDVQVSNKDLLDSLNELAILVQGNWAVKSEVLYGDSSERNSTSVTGISINLFIAARDYLLWLFNQERLVSRLEYSKRVRIPDYDVIELFNQLSIFKRDLLKWELKLPTDTRFLKQFPEVVQRQANFWKVRRNNELSIFHS